MIKTIKKKHVSCVSQIAKSSIYIGQYKSISCERKRLLNISNGSNISVARCYFCYINTVWILFWTIKSTIFKRFMISLFQEMQNQFSRISIKELNFN